MCTWVPCEVMRGGGERGGGRDAGAGRGRMRGDDMGRISARWCWFGLCGLLTTGTYQLVNGESDTLSIGLVAIPVSVRSVARFVKPRQRIPCAGLGNRFCSGARSGWRG